ncbi:MAG: glycine cleavage system protein H [Desulfobacca sp.]|uniref:glycine cleavage system protein H n=1 Tax=Desulfobacca sp. TaxID=2067990 RepID=UPI00404A44DA
MAAKTSEHPPYCIWMEAGVIDYKICNRDFDCANCEFDRAMTEAARRNLALQRAGSYGSERRGVLPPREERRRRPREADQKARGRLAVSSCGPQGVCQRCSFDQLLAEQTELLLKPEPPRLVEVFGLRVPTSCYLHQGHTWVQLESGGQMRIGLDDFSQKVLGPADAIRLPEEGQAWRRNTVGLNLSRGDNQAAVLAPVDGIIEVVNPKVRQNPALAHDDPYGEGWLVLVFPTNLKPDLEQMLYGQQNVAWIDCEAHKLLGMLESAAGVTLPSGGALIDDVYGHFPELGWQRLVKEFLHTS